MSLLRQSDQMTRENNVLDQKPFYSLSSFVHLPKLELMS